MLLLANPRLRLFAGAALISLSPVWVKLVGVPATTSGFYRVFIGGIALGLYLLVVRKPLQFSRRVWQLLGLAAVFFALDLWFWHRSIIYIGPGLSTLLANFQVFILMLAGIFVLRQKPTATQLLAIPLALFGLGMIVGLDWQSLPDDYRLGVVYGLLTALVYAGYLLTMRYSRKDVEHGMPTREIAVISIVSAVILGASAMPQVSTTEAGLALLLQPTLSFVWDVLFFARPMTPTELAGAAIALGAIYLGSRRASKQV
jgi:drug/metabolite transporter (DMT)-like permease